MWKKPTGLPTKIRKAESIAHYIDLYIWTGKKDGKWLKKVKYLRRGEKVFLVWIWTQGETERQYKKDG